MTHESQATRRLFASRPCEDFYSDNNSNAAAWLRELIAAGHLPEGKVDERSIKEINGADLTGFRQVHFFAGIGGWPYALQLAGWPAARPVWTGSCPCQPFSAAGKRKGQADERHLWPVFLRLIRECQPATIFGEQVASDDGYRWLARVRDDLEEAGYAVGCADLPACCAGAPHIRQRLFWVADAGCQRRAGKPVRLRTKEAGKRAATVPQAAGGCIAGERLEHPASDGRGKRRAESDGRGAADGRGAGGMGNADSRASEQHAGKLPAAKNRSSRTRLNDGDLPVGPANAGDGIPARLGHADRAGHQGQNRPGQPGESTEIGPRTDDSGGASFWSATRIIYCRDNKYRRVPVEPALFPLAPRIPGRVGMLRGAGNSIVPQVAAKFIQAFLEAEAS